MKRNIPAASAVSISFTVQASAFIVLNHSEFIINTIVPKYNVIKYNSQFHGLLNE
jgi:hypothetical protein